MISPEEIFILSLGAFAFAALVAVAAVAQHFLDRRAARLYGSYRTSAERFAARCKVGRGGYVSW